MPTDEENLCCRQQPQWCTSRLPHMGVYIIQEGVLQLAVGIWNDVRAQAVAQHPGARNRQFHHAAYRQFVMWQHGLLGAGNRVFVPSCCVLVIRHRYPDPNGQYSKFMPISIVQEYHK